MNRRPHGRKPTIALWMLVAVADVAILVATGGLVALVLILASLAVIAGGFLAARQMLASKPVLAPQKAARDRNRRSA
ncbi:hypothetical protein Ate02nite_71960 [Paractinoplanes tereljensis]|uniref:Uncharacterized protein n=2 Tax=Paractinoplanes tereljensis TaxID=571912 RepID=A0A919NSP7_9ACTN|nr:hypothetical protein Ate02nite_71960 [Actinoplanes tereljensis]